MTENEIVGSGDWESRSVSFETASGTAIADRDVYFLQSNFPSGVRDWVLHLRTEGRFRIANPIQLLGTDMASRVVRKTTELNSDLAAQVSLSLRLIQCLEYRGSTRHLIVETWSQEHLRGEKFLENNWTPLAKDLSVSQAESFGLVMEGSGDTEIDSEELYWGTFTALPKVERVFKDGELESLARQLDARIMSNAQLDETVLRRQLVQWNKQRFSDFQLKTPKRKRRELFRRLMSVSVRQCSSLMRQIAFALLLKPMSHGARQAFEFSSKEETLFEIRYGSYSPLGNINIGFLHDYDEHHAELLNELGRALVCDKEEQKVDAAEQKLYQNVQLLDEFRKARKEIRRDQRQKTRLNTRKESPKDTRWERTEPADSREKSPNANLEVRELLEETKLIFDDLKPRCQRRINALIAANIDWEKAAQAENISKKKFKQRFMETTVPNIRRAINRKRQRGN